MIMITVEFAAIGRFATYPAVLATVDLNIMLIWQVQRRHVSRAFACGSRFAACAAFAFAGGVASAAFDACCLSLTRPCASQRGFLRDWGAFVVHRPAENLSTHARDLLV